MQVVGWHSSANQPYVFANMDASGVARDCNDESFRKAISENCSLCQIYENEPNSEIINCQRPRLVWYTCVMCR